MSIDALLKGADMRFGIRTLILLGNRSENANSACQVEFPRICNSMAQKNIGILEEIEPRAIAAIIIPEESPFHDTKSFRFPRNLSPELSQTLSF